MSNKTGNIIVVGGGLGGLWATLRIVEAGNNVQLFSLFEVKRSHSACAQGGINACMDTKGHNDTPFQHFIDTVKGGGYLVDQAPAKTMTDEAPGVVRAFERMGVTFSRTPEGVMDLRHFGGVKNKRTCFAGASSGQQLLYGVDEQVRHYEDMGKVTKHEWWEFLSIIKDEDGKCRGISAIDLRTMKVETFPADAVVMATGGLGLIYGRSTNSTNSTGAAASRVYQQGAKFMNGEFIQFHPTGLPGDDKNRLMSEAARGEGGRIWVPRDVNDKRDPLDIPEEERYYFLEEWYPAYGNTVPRDVASRAIWKVVKHMGMGLRGEDKVYLDLTHLPEDFVRTRLGAIMEIYETFTGVDPCKYPMEIFPSCHYSMGGLYINWEKDEETGGMKHGSPLNHQTSIPGLFACGECDAGYHGANRLGANSLLSASFSGKIAGESVSAYVKQEKKNLKPVTDEIYEAEKSRQIAINQEVIDCEGGENAFTIHKDLGVLMTNKVGIERNNKDLDEALAGLEELEKRAKNITIKDKSGWSNTTLIYARQVQDMIVLAKVIAKGARLRDEYRGAHYKPEFEILIPEGKFPGDPEWDEYVAKWEANNAKWLKHTIASYSEEGPEISYKDVDVSIYPPKKPRDYR